jgi:hypothetical protein
MHSLLVYRKHSVINQMLEDALHWPISIAGRSNIEGKYSIDLKKDRATSSTSACDARAIPPFDIRYSILRGSAVRYLKMKFHTRFMRCINEKPYQNLY